MLTLVRSEIADFWRNSILENRYPTAKTLMTPIDRSIDLRMRCDHVNVFTYAVLKFNLHALKFNIPAFNFRMYHYKTHMHSVYILLPYTKYLKFHDLLHIKIANIFNSVVVIKMIFEILG